MIGDVVFFRVFNLVVGVIGLAIGVGVILIPKVVALIEKKLDKEFSTDKLEKLLNKRKNITEILLKNPRVFGFLLLVISALLILASLYVL